MLLRAPLCFAQACFSGTYKHPDHLSVRARIHKRKGGVIQSTDARNSALARDMAAHAVRDMGTAHNRFVRFNPEAIEYGIGVYSEVPETAISRFYFRIMTRERPGYAGARPLDRRLANVGVP